MKRKHLWQRYLNSLCRVEALGMTLDVSRMAFPDDFVERMAPAMEKAFDAMEALEGGAVANPTEKRMVGHYWLRAPQLAPSDEIRTDIETTLQRVKQFAADVHHGRVKPPNADRFTQLLSIGIGGSALGPMFVHHALHDPAAARMTVHFIDNTDPDGIARVLSALTVKLPETLCLVVTKSGATPETRNGMAHAEAAYRAAGLQFAPYAAAVTCEGSPLDHLTASQGWLARLPLWDWVGGRTSEFSAAGLLPAALEGLDVDGLLAGAAACDAATRVRDVKKNPAALLALMWHQSTDGRGGKHMVVLPYKDRLLLLGRYLQQLVMESLGKGRSLRGEPVEQGLTVYGNKGSTDQHAYVQQLREGLNNFFVLFVRVLQAGGEAVEVEPGATTGDYLHAFLLGTRDALFENGRESITITIPRVDARGIGALIALFERAVGFYALLIGVNAYDQPGVEAGKMAAASVLQLQRQVMAALSATPQRADQIAHVIGQPDSVETVYAILEHLTADGRAVLTDGDTPTSSRFRRV